jgi:hypothetical protein
MAKFICLRKHKTTDFHCFAQHPEIVSKCVSHQPDYFHTLLLIGASNPLPPLPRPPTQDAAKRAAEQVRAGEAAAAARDEQWRAAEAARNEQLRALRESARARFDAEQDRRAAAELAAHALWRAEHAATVSAQIAQCEAAVAARAHELSMRAEAAQTARWVAQASALCGGGGGAGDGALDGGSRQLGTRLQSDRGSDGDDESGESGHDSHTDDETDESDGGDDGLRAHDRSRRALAAFRSASPSALAPAPVLAASDVRRLEAARALWTESVHAEAERAALERERAYALAALAALNAPLPPLPHAGLGPGSGLGLGLLGMAAPAPVAVMAAGAAGEKSRPSSPPPTGLAQRSRPASPPNV